jgi:flagellar hook-associated protein 1 FlgK
MNNMFDAFSILSANPESFSLRQEAVRAVQSTVSQFQRLDGELQNLETLINQETGTQVKEINRLVSDIARLDSAIITNSAKGRQPDNRSLDVRNQKLQELGEIVALNINFDANDSLTLRIGDIVVLQNGRADTVRQYSDPINNINQIKLETGKVLRDPGGRIGANIRAYEEIIPDYEARLDQLAVNLKNAMNQLHQEGRGLEDDGSRLLFTSTSVSANTLELNQDILNNVNNLALSLTPDAPGNSDNAIRIANLRNDQTIMGTSGLTEFALDLQQEAGGRVASLRTEIETANATRELFVNQQEDLAGVSIDEELANILKFQNAYQASARVLNTAQTLFDSLLRIS